MRTEPAPAESAADDTAASTEGEPRPSWRDALGYTARVFVSVRVGLTLLAVVAITTVPQGGPVGAPGWPPPPQPENLAAALITPWERADALWFLRIAESGYAADDGSPAFFPLFPLTIRAGSFVLGGHPLAAGFLIAHLATFAALALLYRLVESESDAQTARLAVLFLAIFPSAFFLFAPFSESLFLLLAMGSLYAARRSQWVLAGAAGALAAATRPIGLFLALPLVVEGARFVRARGWRGAIEPLAGVGLVPLGTLAYLAFWYQTTGDAMVPVDAQQRWLRSFAWPWETLVRATADAWGLHGGLPGGYHLLDWLIVVPALAVGVYVAIRLPAIYGVYTWVSLLVPLMFAFEGRALMSFPRFLLPVFPIFWGFALLARRYRAVPLVVGTFAGGLALMTALFVNWHFIF